MDRFHEVEPTARRLVQQCLLLPFEQVVIVPPRHRRDTMRRAVLAVSLLAGMPGLAAEGRTASEALRSDPVDVLTPVMFGAACDSDGSPGNGADDTVALQAAIRAAEKRGGRLLLPGRPTMCRVTATLEIHRHLLLDGDSCQPVRNNDGRAATPGAGSWLYFDHGGVGIRQGDAGTQVTGVVLQNFCTMRNQPALVQQGAWAPAPNDFDIVEEQDDLLVRNVLLLNPTKGLSASGRVTIDGLRGQPMQLGLSIDNARDVPRVENVHWWPFWANNKPVEQYTKNNAEAFRWGRADNPFFSNSFAIYAKTCVHLVATAAGVTNKMHAVNIDCDFVGTDGWLDEASGSSGQVANFTTQGAGPIAGERLTSSEHAVQVTAADTVFSFAGMRGTKFGGSSVLTEGGGNSLVLDGLRLDAWGLTAPTAAAIAAGAGDTITIGAGAVIGGAPEKGLIYGGAGTVSAAVTRRVH